MDKGGTINMNGEPISGDFSFVQSLEEANIALGNLIGVMPGGVVIYRLGKTISVDYFSDDIPALSGHSSEEYSAICAENPIDAFVYDDDKPALVRQVDEAYATHAPIDSMYRLVHKDGSLSWIQLSAKLIREEQGDLIYCAVFTPPSVEFDLYRNVIETTTTAILVAEQKTSKVIYANGAWRRLQSVPDGVEIIGTSPANLSYSSRRIVQEDDIAAFTADDFTTLYRVRPDGSRLTVKGKLMNWSGLPAYILYVTDVTGEYEAQMALYRSVTRGSLTSASLNLTRNQVLETRAGEETTITPLRVATVDELFAETADLTLTEQDRIDFTTVFDREKMIESFHRGTAHGQIRYRITSYEGWLELSYDMISNPGTGDIEAFLHARDVTDEMRAELMVHTLTAVDYENIFTFNAQTGAPDTGSLSHQFEGVEQAQDRVGDYQEGVLAFIRECCADEDIERVLRENTFEVILEDLKTKQVHLSHYSIIQDGQVRQKRALYTYLSHDTSTILCAVQDVTEQWQTEVAQQNALRAALKAAKAASEAKSTFLSNMSHEIRTPMNAITGMTKLAEEVEGNPEETKGYLHAIDESSHYLLGVVNDVLDMSRIESGKFELHLEWASPKDIFWTCVNMVASVMREKNITFIYPDVEIDDDLEILVDSLRVKQVLMNILNNAIKFTPEGGRIELSIENVSRDGHHAVDSFTISDTGCGMSKEFLQRIFQPFEQERDPHSDMTPGTGLGLALVKRISEAMGGEVSVISELGKGSSFTFTSPYEYRYAKNLSHTSDDSEASYDLSGRNILLVEDHALNRMIATTLLEREGVNVDQAENGRQAVDMFMASPEGLYDAVLMDIRMPVMDGLEATRVIRACDRDDASNVPIVAMSANAFDEDVQKSLNAGMNRHLSKPIDTRMLYRVLGRLMRGCAEQAC